MTTSQLVTAISSQSCRHQLHIASRYRDASKRRTARYFRYSFCINISRHYSIYLGTELYTIWCRAARPKAGINNSLMLHLHTGSRILRDNWVLSPADIAITACRDAICWRIYTQVSDFTFNDIRARRRFMLATPSQNITFSRPPPLSFTTGRFIGNFIYGGHKYTLMPSLLYVTSRHLTSIRWRSICSNQVNRFYVYDWRFLRRIFGGGRLGSNSAYQLGSHGRSMQLIAYAGSTTYQFCWPRAALSGYIIEGRIFPRFTPPVWRPAADRHMSGKSDVRHFNILLASCYTSFTDEASFILAADFGDGRSILYLMLCAEYIHSRRFAIDYLFSGSQHAAIYDGQYFSSSILPIRTRRSDTLVPTNFEQKLIKPFNTDARIFQLHDVYNKQYCPTCKICSPSASSYFFFSKSRFQQKSNPTTFCSNKP